jgi:sterol 24-C-methyltransferase
MATRLSEVLKKSLDKEEVADRADEYVGLHDEDAGGDVNARKSNYMKMVNAYYDLVTDFYEYGWGQCFHFAPRFKGEDFHASIARHEHYLALRLGMKPGMRVLDVGAGVGGPMRAIARFSGSNVVGINNNEYQIKRGGKHNEEQRLAHLCSFIKGDFMNNPEPDGAFDAAYAIEATVHAPDPVACYSEVRRVLKPGALFAAYEWCLTPKYDADNPKHREIKKGIEEGDSLPDINSTERIKAAVQEAGFEVLESRDIALESDPETPWELPLTARGGGVNAIRASGPGRWATHQAVKVLERVGVAPKGSEAVHDFLRAAAEALVQGGETGIFTPMFFFLARNPK